MWMKVVLNSYVVLISAPFCFQKRTRVQRKLEEKRTETLFGHYFLHLICFTMKGSFCSKNSCKMAEIHSCIQFLVVGRKNSTGPPYSNIPHGMGGPFVLLGLGLGKSWVLFLVLERFQSSPNVAKGILGPRRTYNIWKSWKISKFEIQNPPFLLVCHSLVAMLHQRSSYAQKDTYTNMSVDVCTVLRNARANFH